MKKIDFKDAMTFINTVGHNAIFVLQDKNETVYTLGLSNTDDKPQEIYDEDIKIPNLPYISIIMNINGYPYHIFVFKGAVLNENHLRRFIKQTSEKLLK